VPFLAAALILLFVVFVSLCSKRVRTGKYEPGDSVNKLDLVEVEQQPKRHVEQIGTEGNEGNEVCKGSSFERPTERPPA
jgi:hypothetical protein